MVRFDDQLELARQGDQLALDELLKYCRPLLRLQARGILGAGMSARADSSDVVQETLTQASRDVADFRGCTEGEWVVWLQKILLGHAAKVRRHHKAAMRSVGREANSIPLPVKDKGLDPLSQIVDLEQMARVANAIEELPRVMQEVVIRRVFEQQPFDQVAQAVNRSPGATRVLWTRAVRKLRDSIGDSLNGGLLPTVTSQEELDSTK